MLIVFKEALINVVSTLVASMTSSVFCGLGTQVTLIRIPEIEDFEKERMISRLPCLSLIPQI